MTRFSFNYKTASGVGSLVLEKCTETFFKQFKLLGNSVQQETPSPDFPQEIKNVGKLNSDTGKYEVDVQVTGKNLLDISACEDGKVLDVNGDISNNANALLTDFIQCFPKTPYCRPKRHFTVIAFYDLKKNKMGFINQYDSCFTTPDKCRYFRFALNKTNADYKKTVVNVGKELAEYEPYREPQTVKLSLDQPLRGIGEHKDEVTKDGVVRRIKQITLNGSENWSLSNAVLVNTNKFYLPKVDDAYSAYRKISSLVDALPFVADENSDELGQRFYLGNPMINLDKEKFPNVDTLKKYLSENPMTVQYALAEPIIEPLAEENKLALESLYTNNGTTVIAVDGGEVEAKIEVEYAVKE